MPLTEALYVLNLSAGENSEKLEEALRLLKREDFEYYETNPPLKPEEVLVLIDSSNRITPIEVIDEAGFDMKTGDVLYGPLPRPLDKIAIELIENGDVWAIGREAGDHQSA